MKIESRTVHQNGISGIQHDARAAKSPRNGNEIFETFQAIGRIDNTFEGRVAKFTGCLLTGTALGGICGGPVGLGIGAAVGAITGVACAILTD